MSKSFLPNTNWFSSRLVSRFEEIKSAHTTIVASPSGYGKTTIGGRLFSEIPAGVTKIWHTAIAGSAKSVWRQICATLGKIDAPTGQELLSLGLPDEDTLADVAYTLADVACENETWLFLDDFQILERVTGSEVWKEFFRHRADNLHIVIFTRQFGDSSLRGGTGVAWFDFSDLALKDDEITAFFKASGVNITKKQAMSVYELTNGCIQGISLEKERFAETGEFSALEDESAYHGMIRATIWKGLTEEQKVFLLRVSPFESYTLEQAAFLLGPDGEAIPQYALDVSKDRAFVQHITTDIYYYPHSRILDFCRAELIKVKKSSKLREEILGRAAEWCLESRNYGGAVAFYCLNGDYDKALSIDIRGQEVFLPAGVSYVDLAVGIVRNASQDAKIRYPVHLLKYAFGLLDFGRVDVFAAACKEMAVLLETADIQPNEKRRLFGELTLLSSFGEYNNISKMNVLMRQAHELTGGRPSLISMKDSWTFGNASVLFMFHSESGRLERELADMKEGCPLYITLTGGHGSGADLLMEAEALFNGGDMNNAAFTARKALSQAEDMKQASLCIGACLLLARAAVMDGDADELTSMRDRIVEYAERGLKRDRQEAEMAEFWISLLTRGSPLKNLLDGGPRKPVHIQAMPYAGVLLGKYLIAGTTVTGLPTVNGAKKWLGAADGVLANSRALRCLMGEIYCHIISACALQATGNRDRAASVLQTALDIAMPDQLYMPFAEHFFHSHSLLSLHSLEEMIPKEAIKKIRPLAERLVAGTKAIEHRMPIRLPFGLSEREYEAASLAAQGYSNPEIADRLFVSRDAVKFYLKRAYKKIGVSSRSGLEEALPPK